jgi:hypothetical protein
MKTGRLFWGVFLLSLGGAFLLQRFGVLSLQWHHAWQWWPLVLVAWGVALLFGGKIVKMIAVVVAAVVLALALTAMLSFSWWEDNRGNGVMAKEQVFQEEFSPEAKTASFTLDSGAGTFTIGDTTSQFLAVSTTTSFGDYALDKNGTDFTLRLLGSGGKHWPPGRVRNHVDVRLNPSPTWDLHFDVGAAKVKCDLTQYAVQNLSFDCGAADVNIRLGAKAKECTVNVDAGASSLKIAVPESAGCELNVDAPLSSKVFPGFHKTSSGHYETDNTSTATQRFFFNIDAGVSSIRIERY